MRHAVCTMLAGMTCAVAPLAAQDFPDRPIRMLTPSLPGGAPDVGARIVADRLSVRLGQKVVVENRAGAGGVIGLELLKNAPPNGYTIASTQIGPLTIMPLIEDKLPFDPLRDFTHITNLLIFPTALIAHTSLPAKNVRELIALARARPGEITYASSGVGGTVHTHAELFSLMANIKMHRIQFKSLPPAMVSVLSGESQISFPNLSAALPHVHGGRLRVLGVTSANRLPTLPDIPTIAESGVPGYEATGGVGMVGPANMPRNILQRLNREIVDILNSTEVRDIFLKVSMLPSPTTPEGFTTYIQSELKKWAPVVKQAGMKGE